MERSKPAANLDLCLDFADTVDWRTSDHAKDFLDGYGKLLSWSVEKGAIGEAEAGRLLRLVGERENLGEEALKEARILREALYRIFSSAAHGRGADAADVAILNGFLARALAKKEVRMTEEGYKWGWCDGDSADKMLYPVAQSAADLLTSEDLSRVKECANEEEGCGSLFLDSSRSQSRKWCSMESCGNRMKFRTYYDRHSRAKR
jgi:predicted RNA-binding Zn ribbon-like protein